MKKIALSLLCIHLVSFGNNTQNETTQKFEITARQNKKRTTGFAWFTAGFNLLDNGTQATYDSTFPVSGIVALKETVSPQVPATVDRYTQYSYFSQVSKSSRK